MKEELKKLPMCTYKKNIFKFDKTTDIPDGEYMIFRNKIDDFSLYSLESYIKIEEKIREISTQDTNKRNFVRYIFTIADKVTVEGGKLKLSARYSDDIYSETFYVKKCDGYIRLIGSESEEIAEKGFIEAFLS